MPNGEIVKAVLIPGWKVELRLGGRRWRGAPVGKVSLDQRFHFGNIVFVSGRKFGVDSGIKCGGLPVIDST